MTLSITAFIKAIITTAALAVAMAAPSQGWRENPINDRYCAMLGGERETLHRYRHGYVRADCETATHIIEAGLDKRSSLDSLQQVIFITRRSAKQPVIVIYDTDGKEGQYEYQIRCAVEVTRAQAQKVEYRRIRVKRIGTEITLRRYTYTPKPCPS